MGRRDNEHVDRVSMSLGRVNASMQVKISLVLREDKPIPGQELISKFEVGGNRYILVNPHPFITIDISKKKGSNDGGWDPNNSINITRPYLRPVIKVLQDSLDNLKVPDMFFYDHGKLLVNKEKAAKYVEKIAIKNKYLKVLPVVISEEGDKDEYERLAFMINDPAHFCYLTIEECELLIDILSKTDMTQLSLSLMSIASDMKTAEMRKIERSFPKEQQEVGVEDKTIHNSVKSEMDDVN